MQFAGVSGQFEDEGAFAKGAYSVRRARLAYRLALVLLLALGAGLRFASIGYGRDVLTPRPDAELVRSAVLNSLTGDLNPHYAVWGHLYHYLYLLAWSAVLLAKLLCGAVDSWFEAIAACHIEPWGMMVCGRAISAMAGALTIVATWRLGLAVSGSRLVGLAAASIIAVMFLHVRDSHFATADILLTLLCTVALTSLVSRTRSAVRAGMATGAALATKLLAATVVLSVLSWLAIKLLSKSLRITDIKWFGRFLLYTTLTWILLQPFILLDPMETWYGIFGDLFNPERRPLERGLNITNAAIIVNYYVPQAMGWLVGAAAVVGGLVSLGRLVRPLCYAGTGTDKAVDKTIRGKRRAFRLHLAIKLGRLFEYPGSEGNLILVGYAFWSLLALVSVQRIFLRYLDPLLPAVAVFAAVGISWLTKTTSRCGASLAATARAQWSLIPHKSGAKSPQFVSSESSPAATRHGYSRSRWRVAGTLFLLAILCAGNVKRSVQLARCLNREDTRAIAKRWIEQNVPEGERILWCGYGQIVAHLTMPWLHVKEECDRARMKYRRKLGLPTHVDELVVALKRRRSLPTYHVVGVNIGPERPEQSALVAYPFLRHDYPIMLLKWLDQLSRTLGLLRPESPRWELMRRHVCSVWQTSYEALSSSGERYIVLTGMPCDPAAVRILERNYRQVLVIDPGVPWEQYLSEVMYDTGDAWYVPNIGIARVTRPGPQIRIFVKRGWQERVK